MGDRILSIFLIICLIFAIFSPVFSYFYKQFKKSLIDNKIELLASGCEELTPKEFFKLRNYSLGGQGRPQYARTKNFAGVYIIYNKTKNMYYVGQAHKILDRVNSHFTGKGNGDVYADYKYGDEMTIKMIALKNSGFNNLNDLERHTISKYNSYSKGYNKTRGNM